MSEKIPPIVPTVFVIGAQSKPYEAAPITRYQTLYHTQLTVRGQAPPSKAETIQQTNAYCLPDDAAWSAVQAAYTALKEALAALGADLRELGSYRSRLNAAGGIKAAPNPLSPTAISISDPENAQRWWFTALDVPRIERIALDRHTPEMLRETGKDYTGRNQKDHTICPTDSDWERVEQLHRTARQAQDAWEALLQELGTYKAALEDGRYRQPVVIPHLDMRIPELVTPITPGPRANDFDQGSLVIWTRADGAEILGRVPPESAMPRYVDPARCRPAPAAPKEEQSMAGPTDAFHNLPPKLAGWRWQQNNTTQEWCLVAPDGSWRTKDYTYSNKAISEALRRVNSAPKLEPEPEAATVEPAPGALVPARVVEAVLMMDQAEARETVAAMRGDLDQVDHSLSSFRQRALEFADRQGWKALGYGGALEAINAELGTHYSKSYLSRLLGAARIERILELPIGNSVPESHLRPMADLETPDEQRAAWERSGEIAGGAPRTAAHVAQAVAEQRPASVPATAPSLEEIFTRLDVHGWARFGEPRTKGMTTFHKFLNQGDGEEAELAEGELPFWLAELDQRAALRVARQATPSPRLGPGQPEPTPWPDPPPGWRWNRRGAPAHLIAPDGWTTQNYNVPERALAEAQQHLALAEDRNRLAIARTHLDLARPPAQAGQARWHVAEARKMFYQVSDQLASVRQALEEEAASILAEFDRQETVGAIAAVEDPAPPAPVLPAPAPYARLRTYLDPSLYRVRSDASRMLEKRLDACDEVLIRLLAQALYQEHRLVDVWVDDLWRLRAFVGARLFEELHAADPDRALRMFRLPDDAQPAVAAERPSSTSLLARIEELQEVGAQADPEELRAVRRDLEDLAAVLDDATYESLAGHLSMIEADLKEATA